MDADLCILACGNFEKELKTAVAAGEFEGIATAIFPAMCGHPPIGWDDIARIIQTQPDCPRFHLLGGCCIAGLANPPESLNHCRVHKLGQCFHLFADSGFIDGYISRGAYLLTPGWLSRWRDQICQWGFDKEGAEDFFGETVNSIALLDTGVDSASAEQLRAFAEYVARPFEIVNTGLGFFRLFLEKIVLQWRLEHERNQSRSALNDAYKQSSEYAAAMDLLNNLTLKINEDEAIRDIIDIFSMLFAPKEVWYLPVDKEKPGKIFKSALSSSASEESIRERLIGLNRDYAWTESDAGFRLRIKGRDQTLGILEADHLTFPERRNHYLNLALTVTGVCGLVIENARFFRDLIKTNKDLEKARICAEEAKRVKSEFLANMTHELRTPLNVILGFTQLMARARNLDTEQLKNLVTIRRNGEHLLTLINQVLNMSKIEAGGVTLDIKDFDFYRLLDDLEDMFRAQADKKELSIAFERQPDLPRHIRTDETKLKQVLINLINNAVKFTNQGGISIRIGAESKAGQRTFDIQFEVEDSGAGMTSAEIEQVFEPFVQTDAGRRAREGTGLGLPISLEFIEMMGGGISVKSEIGRGTIFSFNISAGEGKASSVSSQKPVRRVTGLAPDQICFRILVVDDRRDNRTLLIKLLAPLGFEVREALNGLEAVKIWEDWRPHLVWMDLCMPVMDGQEAMRRIKEAPKGQTAAVIALTASVIEEEEIIVSRGFDDYLRKPFREEDIFDMMRKHIGVRYVYEETRAANVPEVTPVMDIPSEFRSGIRAAIQQLDDDRLQDLIETIRLQNTALADFLAGLASNYEYDRILELLNIKAGE